MAVLKTTSPERSTGAPKLLPSKTVPSSKARIADSNTMSSWEWVTPSLPNLRRLLQNHNRCLLRLDLALHGRHFSVTDLNVDGAVFSLVRHRLASRAGGDLHGGIAESAQQLGALHTGHDSGRIFVDHRWLGRL